LIADRPVRQLKDKIRALTPATSQQNPRAVLIRLNQIMRGWAYYFRHAVAKAVFRKLENFVWRRVIRWLKTLHHWSWKDIRRWLARPDGSWKPIAVGGIALLDLGDIPVYRYRYRGSKIPNPWATS
jgi:RNA-directed DNA polymerase